MSQRSSSACSVAFKSIGHRVAGTSAESWAGACPGAKDAADGREGGASWSGEGESAPTEISAFLANGSITMVLIRLSVSPVRNKERSITFLSSLMFPGQ